MKSLDRRHFIAASLSGLYAAQTWSRGVSKGSLLNARRLRRLHGLLERNVESRMIAGGVALVMQHGEPVLLEAVGAHCLESNASMRTDSIFQIMSMSKPFIAAAVMKLVESGSVSLEGAIDQYLPEFGDLWMFAERASDRVELTRPSRKPTLGELLTHSAGLIDMPAVIGRGKFPLKLTMSLAEIAMMVSQSPLEYEPGARSVYSNCGIAMAARIVEKVAGVPYETFIARSFFEPLGMKDSFFFPQAEHWPRIPCCYEHKDGKLVEMGDGTPGGRNTRLRINARSSVPEAGIYSTALDIAKLYQLMLNRGHWSGQRILTEASVDSMISTHIQDEPTTTPDRVGTGQGLAWRVARLPEGSKREPVTASRSFSHAGALGTYGWADPNNDLVGILLIQQPNAMQLREDFVSVVRGSLLA